MRTSFALAGLVLAGVGCLPARPAAPAPPPGGDTEFSPWFRSLRTPQTGQSCCGVADCRRVQYRIVHDHFQAYIGGEFPRWQSPPHAWVDVPETSVLHRHDNPTGEAVACWASGAVVCFVEGQGG
jgi:hypothetical protein